MCGINANKPISLRKEKSLMTEELSGFWMGSQLLFPHCCLYIISCLNLVEKPYKKRS